MLLFRCLAILHGSVTAEMGFSYLPKKICANTQAETMVLRVNLNEPKKLTHANYRDRDYVLKYLERYNRLDSPSDLGGDPRRAIIKRKPKVTRSIPL